MILAPLQSHSQATFWSTNIKMISSATMKEESLNNYKDLMSNWTPFSLIWINYTRAFVYSEHIGESIVIMFVSKYILIILILKPLYNTMISIGILNVDIVSDSVNEKECINNWYIQKTDLHQWIYDCMTFIN